MMCFPKCLDVLVLLAIRLCVSVAPLVINVPAVVSIMSYFCSYCGHLKHG